MIFSRLTFALLGVAASLVLPARADSYVPTAMSAQAAGGAANIAEVDEATARKLVKGCSIPKEMKGLGEAGSQTILQFNVSETGKLLGVHRVQGVLNHELSATFASCHFAVYKVDGTPAPFQTNITITAK
jgi:hypothetical protein